MLGCFIGSLLNLIGCDLVRVSIFNVMLVCVV